MSEPEYSTYDPDEVIEDPYPSSSLPDEVPGFKEELKMDFMQLSSIGALSSQFEWLGHKFVMRTLKQGELLLVAQVLQPYQNTIAQSPAFAAAMVASSLVSVDGKPISEQIDRGYSRLEIAQKRFEYVKDHWYQYVIDYCYSRYLELEGKAKDVVAEMGKA